MRPLLHCPSDSLGRHCVSEIHGSNLNRRIDYEGQPTACAFASRDSIIRLRGNTFTYLVVALALVSENLRKLLSFYKNKLALKTLTAKNQDVAKSFWQSRAPISHQDELRPTG
ncbi:hypothetical protein [Diaminobutyricimonas sp. LJ205]|uniref:hypothetical protein n=1 Tax=Diaminobutyricimonas sp. LJ205 TaxID=2683590 RepID=UPI0012F4BE04|nr:hypothetical protein [Diaminobutyricimonas sp. LJ205]